jgi:hypothetical protein
MLTILRHLADRFDALPWQWQIALCALVLLTATAAIGVSYIIAAESQHTDRPSQVSTGASEFSDGR